MRDKVSAHQGGMPASEMGPPQQMPSGALLPRTAVPPASQFCRSHGLMMPMPDRGGCCWYCARDEAKTAPGPVVRVWTFSNNGMVMATDPAGEQVPEYQGRLEDVRDKIMRDFPGAEWMEPFDFAAAAREAREAGNGWMEP